VDVFIGSDVLIQKFMDGFCKILSMVMATCLAVMVVLVFGNVVMRYAFNSGITLSEELSRWLFVWMTFMGAIVALKEHGHLGTDMLVGKLPPAGKKVCLALSYGLMLFICWLLFSGAYQQTMINLESTSAVMEVSMAWIYAPGVVFAVLGGLVLLTDLMRVLAGQVRDDDLVMIQETEESPHGADKA
jgi:TRAP-type C4-dicarboxylate transport system permease small subunit